MKADTDLSGSLSSASDSKLFVGRFVRRQGNYGTVSVVGRVGDTGIDVIEEPKRLFPRDGLVETHGVAQVRLAAGDWVEFDIARNQRPRAPEYKVVRLQRIPRYAILPDATDAIYRAMLTVEGWRGDRRSGLWALRIAGDRVLVVELEAGKDGALRVPRKSAREVRWCGYDDGLVVSLPADGGDEKIYLPALRGLTGTFDWSDEADHVAQVIRSLSDVNDPHITDLISWLEMHHEEQTGRVFAGAMDHDAARASLRSGELAERLRADRGLMKAYLDAALEDDDVRDAVAQWTREGHGAEADRLRSEFAREIDDERIRLTEELAKEIERKRKEALERVETEAAALADRRLQAFAAREREADEALTTKLKELDSRFDGRKSVLERELTEQGDALAALRDATHAATGELERVRAETKEARLRLRDASADVDRLLAIVDRLEAPSPVPVAPARGATFGFADRPLAAASAKGLAISQTVLLTDKGKDLLRSLVFLLMAGELPILMGSEIPDFLRIAEALICPGRSATIEADPTIISIDDLWSRPGSGAPTAMSAAAVAAGTGAAFVMVRDIERSGARFWVPALAEALRCGGFPRGLLVCCAVSDRDHEEVGALPRDLHWLQVEGTIAESAYLGAASLLRPPALELAALDPGPPPEDLSEANTLIATLGFKPPLGQALRIARMFVEAKALLDDSAKARSLVQGLARSMAARAG